MSLLVESIKVQNRIPQNLEYHNARLNKSRQELFGATKRIDLHEVLQIPMELNDDVHKCRIVYTETIQFQEYLPYTPRIIRTLQLVIDNEIEYTHKYLDRSQLDKLFGKKCADDILIVKNQRITDSSSANVAFYDGMLWRTPANPLLKGTKRQELLDKGIIQEEDIRVHDLKRFQKCVLINAMIDFHEAHHIPIDHIVD